MNDNEIFATMAAGAAGRFWPVVDGVPEPPEMHGAIRRDRDGYWVVDVEGWQSEGDGNGPERGYPDTMVGVLGSGTVFLSDRHRWRDYPQGMQQSLHVVRLSFETAVTYLDVNSVAADGIVMAEVIFPNQHAWARYQLPEWRWREADDPLGKGVSLDFTPSEVATVSLGDELTLALRPTWWSSREIDQLRIGTGLSLELSSDQPIPTARYVQALGWMQDLIGLCWGGRVLPVPGAGRVNRALDDPGRFSSQPLLDPHHGRLANLSHPFPAVYLQDLGGPEAFGRWIHLCRDYRRATRGVSEGLYVGASVETRLLNTVTAIAYWVGKHRRTHPWASVKHADKDNELRLLTMHFLAQFEGWFGDGRLFSERLWWDYNQLKHDPAHTIDYNLVSVFTSGARMLLLADLLDTVAGTTTPSERIADHYWQLRDGVREILEDKERCRVADNRHRRHRHGRSASTGVNARPYNR
jgi:hypothetical protein